jgi:glucosylceramidase
VTSASGAYWKTGTWTESTASATVTVNDTSAAQAWEGFGGAFNELGWKYLTSAEMQAEAMKLLFDSTDGAGFSWGRIPMGASDYGESRYTYDDTGTDVTPDSSEGNRPAADTSLSKFSLDRDGQKLIPYIKAAQKVNPALRFWASPWTPPVWMKTGYKKDAAGSGTAKKASYFDGGNFKNDASFLTAYAEYYKKFVQGYKEQGINVEIVSPQNEPGYDQNYPSCLWDKTTYVAWIKALGPVMKDLGVKVMLGTLSNAGDNSRNDLDIASAVLADSTAKGFVSVVGVQWGVLDKVNGGQSFSGLPVWASEHKCGNYPWNPSGYPSYNSTQAPNDQAYGVESWGYIRDAIKKGKVTSYNAWNMVLDKTGLGNDTSRDWRQDALLVADGGKVNATPAYYVFRHFAQYVVPGATVVGTTGGDAVAFKNPDGSIVAVMYNKDAANSSYSVKIGSKTLQFSMPAQGWATVKYKP